VRTCPLFKIYKSPFIGIEAACILSLRLCLAVV